FKACVLRNAPTAPSNFRAQMTLHEWLSKHDRGGIYGIDTRALTHLLREQGAQNCAIIAGKMGEDSFDKDSTLAQIRTWEGLENSDLAGRVSTKSPYVWTGRGNDRAGQWQAHSGYADQENGKLRIVCIDYGVKHNILRNFVGLGCHVNVVPADTPVADILDLSPDGIFLSNGPGDPAATGVYAVPIVQELLRYDIPIFGICLGHQILALALGAKTKKMHNGHHGANHPIRDLTTDKVEITSQNHGFVVDEDTLPDNLIPTHFSLFDGTLAGVVMKDKPVFSVQYHPEASPGPMDSHYLFRRFIDMVAA
ncbi:MAG: glutamine-hydrolyzing carbamoyl-phosphate synthase small subunit, partial [Pseudomonadota bacterium]